MRTTFVFAGSILIALTVGCAATQEAPVKPAQPALSAPAALSEVERYKAYAVKIKQAVRRNFLVGDLKAIEGSPVTDVEVRTAPDGAIVQTRLLGNSGSPVWDQMVLDALQRTRYLPLDIDGRIPPIMIITFRPQ